MENQRGDEPGRRDEDARWLKVQKDVMTLVTSTRESQRGIAKLEIEVGKLADHVEDVDDHLRGVAGKESLDTRVTILEKEFEMHGVLLRRISDQFTSLHAFMEEIKHDVSTFKIRRDIGKESEGTRLERLKTWLSFWGPIIALVFGLVVPVGTLLFQHWDKLFPARKVEYKPDERLRKEIAADKAGERGKKVKEKLEAIEKAARE